MFAQRRASGTIPLLEESGESCILCLPYDGIIRYNEAECGGTPCLFVVMNGLYGVCIISETGLLTILAMEYYKV